MFDLLRSFSRIEYKEAPSRFLLLKDAELDWDGDSKLPFDAKIAERIIKKFDDQGVELPIDYHHTTTSVEEGKFSRAPAAGWIKGLEFVEGEGLYATGVRWNDDAKREIEARKFQYISPVILIDKETGVIEQLHSAALTNRPRTKGMPKLIAASNVRKGQDDGADSQDQLAKVITLLDLDPEATLEEVLAAVITTLEGGGGSDGDSDSDEASARATGLAKVIGCSKNELRGEVQKLVLRSANYEGLSARVKRLEGELRQRCKIERDREVQVLISEQIEAGRILPDDENTLSAARKLAESDPEAFKAIYASLDPIVAPGRLVHGTTHTSNRQAVIAKAAREYEADSNVALGGRKQDWINVTLEEEGAERLSDSEVKALN